MYIDSTGSSYRRPSSVRRAVIRNNSAIASSYVATTGTAINRKVSVLKLALTRRSHLRLVSRVYLCLQPRAEVSSWRQALAY
jgi:hypothetical protein